jgi:hypothetical protein
MQRCKAVTGKVSSQNMREEIGRDDTSVIPYKISVSFTPNEVSNIANPACKVERLHTIPDNITIL